MNKPQMCTPPAEPHPAAKYKKLVIMAVIWSTIAVMLTQYTSWHTVMATYPVRTWTAMEWAAALWTGCAAVLVMAAGRVALLALAQVVLQSVPIVMPAWRDMQQRVAAWRDRIARGQAASVKYTPAGKIPMDVSLARTTAGRAALRMSPDVAPDVVAGLALSRARSSVRSRGTPSASGSPSPHSSRQLANPTTLHFSRSAGSQADMLSPELSRSANVLGMSSYRAAQLAAPATQGMGKKFNAQEKLEVTGISLLGLNYADEAVVAGPAEGVPRALPAGQPGSAAAALAPYYAARSTASTVSLSTLCRHLGIKLPQLVTSANLVKRWMAQHIHRTIVQRLSRNATELSQRTELPNNFLVRSADTIGVKVTNNVGEAFTLSELIAKYGTGGAVVPPVFLAERAGGQRPENLLRTRGEIDEDMNPWGLVHTSAARADPARLLAYTTRRLESLALDSDMTLYRGAARVTTAAASTYHARGDELPTDEAICVHLFLCALADAMNTAPRGEDTDAAGTVPPGFLFDPQDLSWYFEAGRQRVAKRARALKPVLLQGSTLPPLADLIGKMKLQVFPEAGRSLALVWDGQELDIRAAVAASPSELEPFGIAQSDCVLWLTLAAWAIIVDRHLCDNLEGRSVHDLRRAMVGAAREVR